MKSYSKKFFYKNLELVYCKEENCFYKVVESELIKLELSEEQVEKGKEFMIKNKRKKKSLIPLRSKELISE